MGMLILADKLCRDCKPALLPSGPRLGEHHIGTRFGKADAKLRVRIEGADKSSYVFELIAGDPGTAFVYCGMDGLFEGPKHKCCNCGQGACSAIVRGRVEVFTDVRRAS